MELVPRALLELLATRVPKEPLETKVEMDTLVLLVLLDKWVELERQATLETKVPRGHTETLEQRVPMETQVIQENCV